MKNGIHCCLKLTVRSEINRDYEMNSESRLLTAPPPIAWTFPAFRIYSQWESYNNSFFS